MVQLGSSGPIRQPTQENEIKNKAIQRKSVKEGNGNFQLIENSAFGFCHVDKLVCTLGNRQKG